MPSILRQLEIRTLKSFGHHPWQRKNKGKVLAVILRSCTFWSGDFPWKFRKHVRIRNNRRQWASSRRLLLRLDRFRLASGVHSAVTSLRRSPRLLSCEHFFFSKVWGMVKDLQWTQKGHSGPGFLILGCKRRYGVSDTGLRQSFPAHEVPGVS